MLQFFRIALLLLITLNLFSCGNGHEGDVYFPLQEGQNWKYKVTTTYPNETIKSELSIETIGKQKFDDKTYYVRRTSSGIDYLINIDKEGVYREGLRTIVELKPRIDAERNYIFRYPLEPGSNWLINSQPLVMINVFPFRQKITGINFSLSYQIESISDSVSVPAGKFENCLKIVAHGVTEIYTDAVNGFNEIPIKVEEWYAPNVGLIKQVRYEMDGEVIKISDTPAYYGGNTALELLSYEKG